MVEMLGGIGYNPLYMLYPVPCPRCNNLIGTHLHFDGPPGTGTFGYAYHCFDCDLTFRAGYEFLKPFREMLVKKKFLFWNYERWEDC